MRNTVRINTIGMRVKLKEWHSTHNLKEKKDKE